MGSFLSCITLTMSWISFLGFCVLYRSSFLYNILTRYLISSFISIVHCICQFIPVLYSLGIGVDALVVVYCTGQVFCILGFRRVARTSDVHLLHWTDSLAICFTHIYNLAL